MGGLTQLEVGELGVASFGKNFHMVHEFGQAFSDSAGAKIVSNFTFDEELTQGDILLSSASEVLTEAKRKSNSTTTSNSSGVSTEIMQLVFIISDGSFERENKGKLTKLIREMAEKGQLLVLLIVDKSIVQRQEVDFSPQTVADALKQWFELIRTMSI